MTIAQQMGITEFPLEIKDFNGNLIYWEKSDEYWVKYKYDSKNNQIYREESTGYWVKYEYDSKGGRIYFENSNGTIVDNRPQTEIQKAIYLLTKEGLLVDGKIFNK